MRLGGPAWSGGKKSGLLGSSASTSEKVLPRKNAGFFDWCWLWLVGWLINILAWGKNWVKEQKGALVSVQVSIVFFW